jgi:predicted DNA-binding transcriptional regulator AlpA
MSNQRSKQGPHVTDRLDGARSAIQQAQNNSAELDLSRLLDYAELARITRKSVVTLRRYRMLGTGPRSLRIGRHIRFQKSDVLAWLDSCASRENGTEA